MKSCFLFLSKKMSAENTDVFLNISERQSNIRRNDGVRTFSITQNKCYLPEAPFTSDQETNIKITSGEHDINQLRDTYLDMTFTAVVSLSTDIANAENSRIFVGWKNSTECLRQLQVLNMNTDTKYIQRECAKEGFLMGTYKSQEEKRNNPFAHSLYSDVEYGINSISGGYYDLTSTLAANTQVEVTLHAIVPITDLLVFKEFDEIPGLLGDITLKFYINKNSLVWAQVDPKKYYDRIQIQSGSSNRRDDLYNQQPYDRRFIQAGRSGIIFTSYDDTNSENIATGSGTLTVHSLTCTRCVCECYGFNVLDNAKKQLVTLYQNPFIIPAKQVDVMNFPNVITTDTTLPTTQYYIGDLGVPLRNVSDIMLVFPMNTTDQTVFINPMLEKVQLKINGKQFPKEAFADTYGARFCAIQVRAGYTLKYVEMDKEWLDSISHSLILSDSVLFDDRVGFWTVSDQTSFVMRFQVERNSSIDRQIFYDGIESGPESVNIQLSFQTTTNTQANIMKRSPQIWLVRDTYWTADSKNGLQYIRYGTPSLA